MKRNDWLFRYTVADLLDASRKRVVYHEDRRGWWNEEYAKAAAKAKAAGVEVREYDVTGGKNAQLVLDVSLQGRINECSMKREYHRKRTEEFAQWVAVLESQPGTGTFDVNMDDALFFGVAQQEPEA